MVEEGFAFVGGGEGVDGGEEAGIYNIIGWRGGYNPKRTKYQKFRNVYHKEKFLGLFNLCWWGFEKSGNESSVQKSTLQVYYSIGEKKELRQLDLFYLGGRREKGKGKQEIIQFGTLFIFSPYILNQRYISKQRKRRRKRIITKTSLCSNFPIDL